MNYAGRFFRIRTGRYTLGIEAIIFDLGGVVIASPMQTFAAHERQHGLQHNFINRMIVANGSDSAWGRLEHGEIAMDAEFFALFDAELAAAGAPNLSSAAIFADVAATAGVNHNMVAAIGLLREAGFKLAALTNNWVDEKDPGVSHSVQSLFDVFVESAVEGVRKPDPRIYQIVIERLGVAPIESVFVDDFIENVEAARSEGLYGIHFKGPDQARSELIELLDGK